MTDPAQPKPSFSPYRRWGIGFHVVLLTLVILSVVAMVNYLSHDYFLRFHLSNLGRIPLSPRTVSLLHSLTNKVNITLYYDKEDPMYSLVADLMKEYGLVNRNLQITTVDYIRDAAAALQLKEKYHSLAAPNAKNFIIFDSGGKVKIAEGNALAKYVIEQVPDSKDREFRRKPVAFEGERVFTAALMAVTSPKPFKAYFLADEGEDSIDSDEATLGYLKLAWTLAENYIEPHKLSLLGTNPIPPDCNLLVIAGPADRISDPALEKIDQYLNQGGRAFILFNFRSIDKPTGLEPILTKWGVSLGTNIIKDPENFTQANLMDMKVYNFSKHPVVNALQQLPLHLVLPRAVGKLPSRSQAADAPVVEVLAASGPKSFADHNPALGEKPFPLMVAVEKGAIKDVVTERATRMIVTGDSVFLGNQLIDSAANRDFASCAVNWLLDRPQLLKDIGSRRIAQYSISLTKTQLQSAEWVLLGGMPGVVLVMGSLVWLRRRR